MTDYDDKLTIITSHRLMDDRGSSSCMNWSFGQGCEMEYCCSGFEEVLRNKDKMGISLQVEKDDDNKVLVWLVTRSVDLCDEEEMKDVSIPVKILLDTKLRLIYCPWCGKELDKYYEKVILNKRSWF